MLKEILRPVLGPAVGRARHAKKVKRARAAISSYLADAPVRCLQLGSGFNVLLGWLNMDLNPIEGTTYFLDATEPFPLPDACIDFVFSEHMIEHLPYTSGRAMLAECYRVLKPGGVLRVSTPNLRTLTSILDQQGEVESAWLKWQKDTFVQWAPRPDPVFVINNFVRDWGHQFIYDETALSEAMELSGFSVMKCEIGKSAHPPLHGLENESRMPPGFLRLETMTFEGVRPA